LGSPAVGDAMRPDLPALVLVFLLLGGCTGSAPASGPAFDGDLDARTVKAGDRAWTAAPGEPLEAEARHVETRFFTDEAAWRKQWPTGQGEPEPVDFQKQVVLEVAWTPVPSSGHGVEFVSATWAAPGGYSVSVRLLSPGDNCAVGAMVSEPFVWVALDRVGTVEDDTPVEVESEEARGPPCE
jgi:hypothetical protein